MLNPGQRHERIAAGLYADRSGDLHVDVELALAWMKTANTWQRQEWLRLALEAIYCRCVPITLSDEYLAALVADNQWEEVHRGGNE